MTLRYYSSLVHLFFTGGSVHSAALYPCLVTAQEKKVVGDGAIFLALHADNDTSEKGVDNTVKYQIGDFFFDCFSCASSQQGTITAVAFCH